MKTCSIKTRLNRRSKLAACTLAVIACLALCVGMAACAPQAGGPASSEELANTGDAEEGADAALPASPIADFTERSTGMFPDIQNNDKYQNSGNRGCAACHDNLWEVDKNNGTYVHITPYVGLKKATYTGDCMACHATSVPRNGNSMAENIHISHYSNNAFLEANGNCWSCHAMSKDKNFETTTKLFDEVKYDAGFGGYPTNDSEDTIAWNKSRGFESGFLSGVTIDSDPQMDVKLDQATNEEEDEFRCVNFVREDGDDVYSSIDANTWKLKVTVNGKETEYSLADLKAMPQTETVNAQWCVMNGFNSGMTDNMPMKGIAIGDLVKAVGATDANAANFTCMDGWFGLGNENLGIQYLIDNEAIIVLENYGHDLDPLQGGPAKLFIPGTGGSASLKNLGAIEFFKTDTPGTISYMALELGAAYTVNSSWFDEDGVTGKVGQPMTFEGSAYGWHIGEWECNPTQIKFSFDYGMTWQTIDVPADFDPDQWAHFTLNWTPKEAGTYILKASAVGADGAEQLGVSNLMVTVTE